MTRRGGIYFVGKREIVLAGKRKKYLVDERRKERYTVGSRNEQVSRTEKDISLSREEERHLLNDRQRNTRVLQERKVSYLR